MAFTITLYNCVNDPRSLNKNLRDGIETSNVRPTGKVDLLNPTFELDYSAALTTKNYCVVGAPFNRSYFITDMQIDIGKKIIISCDVDVLNTYKEDIKELSVNVVRQERKIKEMLPDPNFVYLNQNDVINVLMTPIMSNFFGDQDPNAFCYVLGVQGASNGHIGDIDGFTLLTEQPSNWSLTYMFYWVNTNTPQEPQMYSIGELISRGVLPQSEPSYTSLVQTYGGVYSKNQS